MLAFQHRVLLVPLVKSGRHYLNWRATKIKHHFLTKKDYRYEKLLKIYFPLLLSGGPDTLNHYTMEKHTEC